ncbi:MAG: trypsin-like peptidase domain-containing protein [Chloroflexia bacterium]
MIVRSARQRFPFFAALLLLLALSLAGCQLLNDSPTATPGSGLPTATAVANAPATGGNLTAVPVRTTPNTGVAPAASASPAASTPPAATGFPDVAGVAAKVRPATVLVLNIAQGRVPGSRTVGDVPQGAGTGFIIDASGVIVTNAHVVEGAQKLTVRMPPPDNREFTATLVGTATNNDLAVLRVDTGGTSLPTVPLGNSSQLQVGEWVVAIGNALNLPGGPTVTAGVVSALGRDVDEPSETPGQAGATLFDLIQTDAAINPGNSGGPLVNLRGEVVGINTLGTTDAQGIGFAISIDGAKPIIDELLKTGRVTRPYIGITSQTVTPSIAAAYNLPREDGVILVTIVANTPAQKAGLQKDDIIFAVNDQAVRDGTEFQKALAKFKPGDTITLKVNRGGKEMAVQVTLAERPQGT